MGHVCLLQWAMTNASKHVEMKIQTECTPTSAGKEFPFAWYVLNLQIKGLARLKH
jgi:hypothetical protein